MSGRPAPSIAEALLSRVATTPDVLVQKFDLLREAALVIEFDRKRYFDASFLDERVLSPTTKGGWVGMGALSAACGDVQNLRPLNFIFHAGHVGSTLVSRLLDESGSVLPLREPLTLRLLADAHDVLSKPESIISERRFQQYFEIFMRLWRRGYSDSSSVVLKATSTAGRLAPLLLTQLPQARAIFLNLRAETYITTLLGGQNPIDMRGHGSERMRRLQSFGVVPPAPLHALSVGELAAFSWLVETWSARLAVEAAGARLLVLDFDAFLANVGEGIERVAQHLGVDRDAGFAARAAQSSVLTRYAKAPEHAYSPNLRAEVLADTRARQAEEIRKGLAWLELVAKQNAEASAIVSASA